MSEYYTPDIEEFHVGFECEMKTDDGWEPITIGDSYWATSSMERLLDQGRFRVKYLDKDDIESLGFIFKGDNFYEDTSGNHYLFLEYFNKDNGWYVSYNEDESQFGFSLYVKNKSELVKLLLKANYLVKFRK